MAQPNPHITSLFDEEQSQAVWAGRWRWILLNGEPVREQADAVSDETYRRGYQLGDRFGYTSAAYGVIAAAGRAAMDNVSARLSLDALLAAALEAADAGRRTQRPVPPADWGTLDAAAAQARTNKHQPWRPVAETAWRRGVRAGITAGAVTAVENILDRWRARVGVARAKAVTIGGRPAADLVGELLAQAYRDVTAPWVNAEKTTDVQAQQGHTPPPLPLTRDAADANLPRTAAEVARLSHPTGASIARIREPGVGSRGPRAQPSGRREYTASSGSVAGAGHAHRR